MLRSRAARMTASQRRREGAFGVVGEDDGVDTSGPVRGAVEQALVFDGGRRVAGLDVEAEELLDAADDAGLRDGGERAGDHAEGVEPGGVEDGGEVGALAVVAPEAGEEGLAA